MIDFTQKEHLFDKVQKALMETDFNKLPISDYNKTYIGRLKPFLSYYLIIYLGCFSKVSHYLHKPFDEWVLVDYGGGSGFLSILAKSLGASQVVYVDLNPLSVETIRVLKEELGVGPDVILEGGSGVLAQWCRENEVKPDVLIGIDVIEHIYDLKQFFTDLLTINPEMENMFTTGSNPWNNWKCNRLYKMMKTYESGNAITPNYYTQRFDYISEHFPELSNEDKDIYSQLTRGMIFKDIQHFIETVNTLKPDPHTVPAMVSAYNTCDPKTGNFVERVLPPEEYAYILYPMGYDMIFSKGIYNSIHGNWFKRYICLILNCIINTKGKFGLKLAPFIFMHCRREPKE